MCFNDDLLLRTSLRQSHDTHAQPSKFSDLFQFIYYEEKSLCK